MNSFLLLCDVFSFVFLKKLKPPKRHFEINWPLNRPLIFQKHECSIIKYSTPLCSNGEMASSFNPPAQWTSPEWRGKQPYFSFRRGLNLQRPVSAIFSSNLSNHPKVLLTRRTTHSLKNMYVLLKIFSLIIASMQFLIHFIKTVFTIGILYTNLAHAFGRFYFH